MSEQSELCYYKMAGHNDIFVVVSTVVKVEILRAKINPLRRSSGIRPRQSSPLPS